MLKEKNYEKEVITQAKIRRATTEFINIINDLWYDKSIELVLFRNTLVDKRASEILNLINYAKEFVGKPISVYDALDIAKAIQKYGKENFTKEILERNISDFDLLCEREKYYIKLYDTKINGYNMTDGGLGSLGYEPTEEHRNNMSLSLAGQSHPLYGKSLSEETKRKISEKAKLRKGRPVTEETRKKISASLKGKKNAKKFNEN